MTYGVPTSGQVVNQHAQSGAAKQKELTVLYEDSKFWTTPGTSGFGPLHPNTLEQG